MSLFYPFANRNVTGRHADHAIPALALSTLRAKVILMLESMNVHVALETVTAEQLVAAIFRSDYPIPYRGIGPKECHTQTYAEILKVLRKFGGHGRNRTRASLVRTEKLFPLSYVTDWRSWQDSNPLCASLEERSLSIRASGPYWRCRAESNRHVTVLQTAP